MASDPLDLETLLDAAYPSPAVNTYAGNADDTTATNYVIDAPTDNYNVQVDVINFTSTTTASDDTVTTVAGIAWSMALGADNWETPNTLVYQMWFSPKGWVTDAADSYANYVCTLIDPADSDTDATWVQ